MKFTKITAFGAWFVTCWSFWVLLAVTNGTFPGPGFGQMSDDLTFGQTSQLIWARKSAWWMSCCLLISTSGQFGLPNWPAKFGLTGEKRSDLFSSQVLGDFSLFSTYSSTRWHIFLARTRALALVFKEICGLKRVFSTETHSFKPVWEALFE